MAWLRMGMRIYRIAELMNVSDQEVSVLLLRIRQKLQVGSNQEAVVAYRLEIESVYHENLVSRDDEHQ